MKTSEKYSQVLPAVVKFQQSIGTIAKGAKNPFFKSKYTALPQILDVLNPLLEENKLALFQPVYDDRVHVLLIHESGEWVELEGTKVIAAKTNDPQAYGSAITYARRYSLSSCLTINSDGDDDGEKAMNRQPSKILKEELYVGTKRFQQVASAIRDNAATIDMADQKFKMTAEVREALLAEANKPQA